MMSISSKGVKNMDTFLKRKIYNDLTIWKNDPNRVPLIVEGLRQVGKSYIVDRFARDNYDNVIVFDFRFNKDIRKVFEGNLNVDSIIMNATPYFPDKSFIPYKTVLIFEEIGDCPLARTSLKSFALDKRFDVIATGSLLGVLNYRKKSKIQIPTGYEKIIKMSSLDFEEFLWANGVNEQSVNELKEYTKKRQELPPALENFYKEMIKRYIVVGGMPKAVTQFIATNNYISSREELVGLIRDYRTDFGRFINDNNEEEIDYKLQMHLNQIFDSIPSQLARDSDTFKFKYSEVKRGGRSSEFEGAFEWLEKAGLVLRCFNLSAIEKPLEANTDRTYFKAFIADIGLLMAMYPISVSQELLGGTLDSRKGAIYENLMAVMIDKCNLPLYYFADGTNHLEVDYILESNDGIVLLEEKSTNGKMAASRKVMNGQTPYKANACYKVLQSNFGKGDFYTTIPQYAVPFLLKDIAEEMNKGFELPPLKIDEQ